MCNLNWLKDGMGYMDYMDLQMELGAGYRAPMLSRNS